MSAIHRNWVDPGYQPLKSHQPPMPDMVGAMFIPGDAEMATEPTAFLNVMSDMTDLERAILRMMGNGHGYQAIVKRTRLTLGAVKYHCLDIQGRLGLDPARDYRAQIAYMLGLIDCAQARNGV